MNRELQQELYRLKDETSCSKKYRCISDATHDLCDAKFHALANLLECIDHQKTSCEHSIKVSSIYICNCPLRKFLALNLEKLTSIN